MVDANVRRLALRIQALEKELRNVSTQPQLAQSAVMDGSLAVIIDDAPTMRVGLQYDGTSTAAVVTGPPPPVPTVPLVTERVDGLGVYWDGTFADDSVAPMDFTRVTMHAVPTTEYDGPNQTDQTRIIGEINTATGGEISASLPGVEHVVYLVAWTQAGKFSDASDVATGTPIDIDADVQTAKDSAEAALLAAGNAVKSVVIEYALSDSETTAPTTGWSTSAPARTAGTFIWSRTTTTHGDDTTVTTDPVLITGNTGATGATGSQGIQGPAGTSGQTLYTWLKYADSPTTGMSDSPTGKTYIGLALNKTSATESTTYSDYTWSLIKGADGAQGVAGPAGADGQTTYTWIKYGTSAAGAGLSDDPTGKTYIGIAYNKATATESTTASDYTWSLIQGPQGAKGDTGSQGIQGPAGPSGQTLYTWLKYADDASGTNMSDSPTGKAYIGLALNKTTATESTTASDYTWSLIKGADGAQGIQGPAGANGQATYTWIKYGTSSTGAGLSDDPTGNTYIGIAYNKTTATESTTASDYAWSLIQGPQGATGATGATGKGVSSSAVSYQVSSSGTTAPTGTWSSTPLVAGTGQFLWTRTVITWTDSTTTPFYSVAATGATGSTGATGAAGSNGVGVSSTAVSYQVSSSGTTAPTGTWTASPGTTSPGQFLWTRTVITWTDSTTTAMYAVAAHGATGSTGATGATGPAGADGSDGVGVASTAVTYQVGSSGTTAPTGTWTSTPGTTSTGQFLWSRTVITWTDSTTTTAYGVAAHGATGATGAAGSNGQDATTVHMGNDAVAIPVSTAGAALAAGTITIPFSGWIGTARAAATVSVGTLPAGITLTTNTAATTSADGSIVLSYASGATIGAGAAGDVILTVTCNGMTFAEHFSWARAYTGSQGATGATGSTGATGAAGTAATSLNLDPDSLLIPTSAAGAASAAGSIVATVKGYVGATASATTVGTISGTPSGVTAAIGSNGGTSTTITFSWSSGATIGGAASGVVSIPVTVNGITFTQSVAWSRVPTGATGATGSTGSQGPAGATGATGKGVSSVTTYYLQVTAGHVPSGTELPTTNPPGGGWSLTEPAWTSNTDLYTAQLVVFSDSTFGWSAVSKSSSYTAANKGINDASIAANLATSTVVPGTSDPGQQQGRIWLQQDDSGNVTGIKISDGSNWSSYLLAADQIIVPSSIGNTLIAQGAVTSPKISGDAIDGKTIKGAQLLGGSLVINEDDATLNEVRIDPSTGIKISGPDGHIITQLPSDPNVANYFEGQIVTGNLTTTGKAQLQGAENEISTSSTMTLRNGVTPPANAPVLSNYAITENIALPSGLPGDVAYIFSGMDQPMQSSRYWGALVYRQNGTFGTILSTDGTVSSGSYSATVPPIFAKQESYASSMHPTVCIGSTFYSILDWYGYTNDLTSGHKYLIKWTHGSASYTSYDMGALAHTPDGSGQVSQGVLNTDGTRLLYTNWVGANLYTMLLSTTGGTTAIATWPSSMMGSITNSDVIQPSRYGYVGSSLSVGYGTFDKGANYYYLLAPKSGGYARTIATVASGPTFSVATPSQNAPIFPSDVTVWDGSNYWAGVSVTGIIQSSIQIKKYSTGTDTTKIWAAYTWANSSTGHETPIGPMAQFTPTPYYGVAIQAPNPSTAGGSGDVPQAPQAYAARASSQPAATALNKPNVSRSGTAWSMADFGTTASTPPPTTNTFPDGNSAILQSDAGGFVVKGDGSGSWPLLTNPLTARLNSLEEDTGWVDITLASGFSAQGTPNPGVRRVGSVVYTRGLVAGTFTTGKVTVGTLPTGFWPPDGWLYTLMPCSTNGAAITVTFQNDGGVGVYAANGKTWVGLSGFTYPA